MAFDARSARNKEELDACIKLLWESPYASEPSLSQSEFLECWEVMLSNGFAILDIYEPSTPNLASAMGRFMSNPSRVHESTFYATPFTGMNFVMNVNTAFLSEIISKSDTKEDPIFMLTRRFRDYVKGRSPSPMTKVDDRGKILEHNNALSVMLMHPWIRLSNLLILPLIGAFSRRVVASAHAYHSGIKHNVLLMVTADAQFIPALEFMGPKRLRQVPGDALDSSSKRKFLHLLVKDEDTCRTLGLPEEFSCLRPGYNGQHRFFFESERSRPVANLSRLRQLICFYVRMGYTDQQIATALGPNRNGDPYSAEYVADVMRIALEQLQLAGYGSTLKKQMYESSRTQLERLIREDACPHEFMMYLTPTYPWAG